MAEEKDEKTFKYIDTDIDQKLLLANLRHNARDYAKYQNWDEGRTQEFLSALAKYEEALEAGRLSTINYGNTLHDSELILDNGTANWRDDKGQVITQEQYDALNNRQKKKYKNDFYANREVAKYINGIAEAIYNRDHKSKKKDSSKSTKFDMSTHGLWDKFTASMAPGGTGDLEAWLDLDPYVEKTKKRATVKRAQALSDYIDEYLTSLPEDLDFSGTNWGNRDTYIARLRALQTELANGVDAVDFRLLNQLGGTPEAYRAFFTTEKTPPAAQQEAPSAPAQDAGAGGDSPEVKARLNSLDNAYRKKYNQAGHPRFKMNTKPNGVKFDTTAADKITAYQNALNKANINFSVSALQQSNGREYAPYLEQYGEMNPAAVRRVSVGNYTGWYYLPESLNQDDFSVLAYNPTTHHVARVFYGSLGPEARADYANILRQLDGWSNSSNQPLFQQGGEMPAIQVVNQPDYSMPEAPQMGGSILDIVSSGTGAAAQFDMQQRALSSHTKSDPKTRQIGGEENNYNSSNGGLTGNDYARLGAVAADIAALIDPEPFSALALGLGSDITNLVADINEGYGFWNTAGNFLAGVGLSAVGMIPIFGDAVGSGGKIIKTMVRLAPKVSKALAVSGLLVGVSNGDEILKSLSKIGKDGPENEMTVEDWRNIGLGIQLILGGANVAKNSKTVKNLNARGKSDMVDVLVVDKATGKKTTLRFGHKSDVDALKNAKTVDEANAVINGHKSLRGKYEVATKTGESVQWFGDNSKFYKPWTWRSKTKTTDLHPKAITGAIDYQKIRASAKAGKGIAGKIWHNRENFIAQHGTPRYNPKNNPTPQGKPSPKRKTKQQQQQGQQQGQQGGQQGQQGGQQPNPQTYPQMMTPAEINNAINSAELAMKDLKRKGKAATLADAKQNPHSVSGKQLMDDQGFTEKDLFDLGLWKEGGVVQSARKRVRKALGGDNTINWATGLLNFDDGTSDLTVLQKIARGLPVAPIDIASEGAGTEPKKPLYQTLLEGNPELQKALGLVTPTTDTPTEETQGGAGTPQAEAPTQPTKPAVTTFLNPLETLRNQTHLTRHGSTVNYGTGYTSNMSYANREYGTTAKVNISAISTADGSKRSNKLKTAHGQQGYDYTDAQANTDAARKAWQSVEGNREKDFMNWVRWYIGEHPNATQGEMLAAYNQAIDSQYQYKHEMGTPSYTGEHSYRSGDAVTQFNQTNRRLYGSANDPETGVHGYEPDQESYNGTQTAQRFIDITDTNIPSDQLKWQFKDDDSAEFKALFQGLNKDYTGRYFTGEYAERPAPAVPDPNPAPEEEGPKGDGNADVPGGGEDGDKGKGKGKNKINWAGILQEGLPNILAVSRYYLARNHNKKQLEIAKKMPVMLYRPNERLRWQKGDITALQTGEQEAAQINHLAGMPTTADGRVTTAAQLQAYDQGVNYITRGAQTHDAAKGQSKEANWAQEGLNQDSRYNTATKNSENLVQKQINDLTAEGAYERANYESANGLMGQFETQARDALAENKAYKEAIAKASLQNDIAADMANYGIRCTEAEQQMMNDVLTGKRKLSDLSEDEKNRYDILWAEIDDMVTQRIAASKGADYRPFSPKDRGSAGSAPLLTVDRDGVEITSEREGGRINYGDSEKITIQKLRGKIQKMKTRQRHLEARLNAYEKDLDRAQRGASQYMRGQVKK